MAPPVIKAGPVTRVCHVCGRQYGLSSFEIHLKQCKKLFITQEELKPKSERRPLPKTPPGLDGSGGGRGGGSAGGGGEADGAEGGGFNEGERPTREMIEAMNRAAQETYNEHGMEKCENCGRTFAEGRLAIHAKSCKPGNAARRVDDGAAPRNKKDTGVDYGSVTSVKKSAARLPTAEKDDKEEFAPSRPKTSGTSSGGSPGTRSLAGSLASNRRKVDPQSPSSGTMLQSPLTSAEVDLATLKQELDGKQDGSMIEIIQAKLDHWEATTLATLQEIRDLKQLFEQLKS